MALRSNPTLLQARAAIRAAEGLRIQAGLYPNPSMGYAGEEIAFKDPSRTSEHMFVVEQPIVLGNKLGLSRQVFAHGKEQAEARARAQKKRVLTSVGRLFYEALAAAAMVEFRGSLAGLTREAVEVTRELENVGQADRPDLLAAEIEAQRSELAFLAARDHQDRVWRQLGAVVGDPQLRITTLAGSLEGQMPELDWESSLHRLLAESPELEIARAGVERADAVVRRARVEKIPDLELRGGIGYNFDRFELGPEPVGAEAFIEAMVTVPLFDRNQGAVLAAEAEVDRATEELRRLELSLQERLATAFENYRNARTRAEAYEQQIIPSAEEAYQQYLAGFRDRRAAYPQVLIAQRTLIESKLEYVTALGNLWQSVATIRGLLLVDGLAPAGSMSADDASSGL